MKKFYPLFLSFILLTTYSKAQYVTIPNANFRFILQNDYPSCFNSAGQMDTTCGVIVNETKLQIGGENISNLDGIQYFKSLTYLDCSSNPDINITSLPNSLTYLDCSSSIGINITSLPNSLVYLDCSDNLSLTTLPPLPNSLTYLDCNSTYTTSLPELPTSLTFLDCSQCIELVNLPILPNSLTYLDCSSTLITSLPELPTSLTFLDCNSCQSLDSIPALPNSLVHLDCSEIDEITLNLRAINLPALPSTLRYLDCGNMGAFNGNEVALSSLPTLPNSLDTLICSDNNLTNLPTLPSSLTYLDCGQNQINSLPTTWPEGLVVLACGENPLHNLPSLLPVTLTSLNCGSNQLGTLPPLPNSLVNLNCAGNQLAELPSLPQSITQLDCSYNELSNLTFNLPNLNYLNCSNNLLTSLPSLPNNLLTLICIHNLLNNLPSLPARLTFLQCYQNNNLHCLPLLPDSLMEFDIDTTKIHCLPNKPMYLPIQDIDSVNNYLPQGASLPLCNPVNNEDHCQEFPVLSGTVFYDNNSNGIQDAGELYMPYVKLQLSDGDYTFTNGNGYYEIAADDGLGSYNLSAYAPTYYKAVPVLMNYTFTSFDTLVTQAIAMQPTALVDSLTINLFSYPFFARPGTSFPCQVYYANVGTTTLSPTIIFNYDNTLLTYDSSSNPAIVNNGSSLSLSQPNFVPGQSGSFIAYFSVKTTDVLGDSLKAKVTIATNAISASDSIATIVSSSFDPNDKEATAQLTPQEVANGKPINYTIRFQNTGTDTAFNIVIADTLSSLLQSNTLQMISSSEPCKVTVTGNVVYFEFLNVLLPDSGVNQIGSNGYVSFSVQPQLSVNSGSISNTASIYFDYNAPVVTNTATTQIGINSVVPVKLISFTALTQPGNNNTLLYWSTASEINTKSFVVEQSTDGVNFTPIATVPAKGFGSSYSYNAGDISSIVYYKLEIVDNDGQYTYSTIVTVNNTKTGNQITVLPNPADKWLCVKTNDVSLINTNARIINSEGAIVKEFTLQQNTQTIDVSNLPSGFYYILTQLGSKKVIINR